MTIKRSTLFSLVSVMLLLSGSLIGAQNQPSSDSAPDREYAILLQATGLEEEALDEAMASGSTLAELIQAKGGDMASVVDALVAEDVEALNAEVVAGEFSQEDADAILKMIKDDVTAYLNGDMSFFNGDEGCLAPIDFGIELDNAILLQATGLDDEALDGRWHLVRLLRI